MTQYLKAGGAGQAFGQMGKRFQFGIYDAPALHADQMGMRLGHAHIIAVASVAEPDLDGFPQFFEQGDRLIDRGQARGRKSRLDSGINRFHAGMACGVGQFPEDGQTLGRYPVPGLFQGVHNLKDSGGKCFHGFALLADRVGENPSTINRYK
jgi:hypothetical protein